jgi:LCP family protein required for cell wall assembly
MTGVAPNATVGTWSIAVAVATLVLPLAGIAVGALERPAPAPSELPEPAPAVAEALPAEPAPLVAEPVAPPTPPPPPVNPFPKWTQEESLNFLLLGVDRRIENEIYRADSLVLANLDLRGRRGTVISIPRDLLVNVPGYGQERVNGVYGIGETQKRPGGGLQLLRETLELNLGVRIHHYAAVDFNCFRGTVDALGGVNVDVPGPIYDPLYPTDNFGYKLVTFEPGPQWMDGERALEFARSRYGDTDFGRMRRQQHLIAALREQALQVKSLAALPQAVRSCGGMSSDLNVLELVALGSAAREIKESNITLKVIDEQYAVPYVAPSGASVLMPRWNEIRAMVRASFAGNTASASAANP